MINKYRLQPQKKFSAGEFLRQLYESRRQALPSMGTRSIGAMLVAVTFAMALSSILLSLSWVQRSEIDYLRSSSVVKIFDNQKWQIELPENQSETHDFLDLASIGFPNNSQRSVTLKTTIATSDLRTIEPSTSGENIVLAIPAFAFESATLETTWTQKRSYLAGEPLTVTFPPITDEGKRPMQTLKLTIVPQKNQTTILPSAINQIPMYVSGQIRYQKFQDFVASRRVGSGKQLADLGRIVLALFSVLLFVFIDSSAECLGLGIFMSLKALGVVASQRWYPDSMLPAWIIESLPRFLLGFADFMQLYFFTQLARLFKPRPMEWLAYGLLFGLVYGYGSGIQPSPGGINWGREVWRYRNLAIGFGCLACSLPVAIICFKDKNYHRAIALIIATSGVLSQIITPIICDIQGVTDMLWYKTWYNLLETHTPYVFALSTFVNVSTLEKRVKTLSESAVKAKLIESDMTLGKAVQDTFFRIQKMPIGVQIAVSHQAEMYVSGDMIYTYFDSVNNTATALLCDVTGHGVQAALKASVCSVICDSIWDTNKLRKDDNPYKRLEILHNRASSFFTKTTGTKELLAVIGCEFSIDEHAAYIYRANAVFPLIVEQKTSNLWAPRLIPAPNNSIHRVEISGQSMIVLFSDGLMDSSRTYRRFCTWLEGRLQSEPGLNAELLKAIILSYDQWRDTHDDQTMCILAVA